MNLYKNISLSVYAFGYGCNFVNDKRKDAKSFQNLSLKDIAKISLDNDLGGIEVPVDRYFPDLNTKDLESFIDYLNSYNLRLIFALENLEPEYVKKLAPIIKKTGLNFVRAKVCNFYGGNRFIQKNYIEDKEKFSKKLAQSMEALIANNIKVLIENHQDVTAKDIEDLINIYGDEYIGVNWDTGNSFPTGETIESFVKKLGNYIGNIHLKDYRLELTKKGYKMHRCELGKGVVDFHKLIPNIIKTYKKDMPFTIELGAMVGREAYINDINYWLHTKGVSADDKNVFINFIKNNCNADTNNLSLWERSKSPEMIAKSEMKEVHLSIKLIKDIINNINK